MKSILNSIARFCGTLNEWVGKIISWLTLALVLLVCYNVVCRKFFNEADAWRVELEWHIFALIFLFGAGYALRHDRHVRVDLFYANYTKREKAWTNLIGGLVFLIPWCILIIVYSWDFGYNAFLINEISPNPNGLKYRYLIKFAITIGVSFLLLQAVASVAESLLILLEKKEKEVIE